MFVERLAERLKTLLLRPALPPETRLRLRQQRLDEEADRRSRYLLTTPDLSVTLAVAVDGHGSPEEVRVFPRLPGSTWQPSPVSEVGRWCANGAIHWADGRLSAVGATGWAARWRPEPGGLLPGFDAAEVAAAGLRPATSGQSRDRIAAIAAVGLARHHVQRVYFLDAEFRELDRLPALGLVEADLVRVAEAAGIAYRRYVLSIAKFASLRVSPHSLCEVLFPRSARPTAARPDGEDLTDWFSEYPGSRNW